MLGVAGHVRHLLVEAALVVDPALDDLEPLEEPARPVLGTGVVKRADRTQEPLFAVGDG